MIRFLFLICSFRLFVVGFILKPSLVLHNMNVSQRRDLHVIYGSDEIKSSDIIERLDLNCKFGRWKFLQDIIEEDSEPRDVNLILYKVLKSFYDNPRPAKTEDGITNCSPILTEDQRSLLVEDLFDTRISLGVITILPVDGDEMTEKHTRTLELLDTLQPDPIENEDDFKGAWDILVEIYGRESTKIAQQNGDEQFKFRSSIVRLLLHFDFLTEGIGE